MACAQPSEGCVTISSLQINLEKLHHIDSEECMAKAISLVEQVSACQRAHTNPRSLAEHVA